MADGERERLRFWQEFKKETKAYFSETTVHGFRYVVEGRTIMERMIWIIFITVGFALGINLIYKSVDDWNNSPVETTIGEVSAPVQELPFPAITVCDTDSLQMPRRNRWMFLEKLLNAVGLKYPEDVMQNIYPGKIIVHRSPGNRQIMGRGSI